MTRRKRLQYDRIVLLMLAPHESVSVLTTSKRDIFRDGSDGVGSGFFIGHTTKWAACTVRRCLPSNCWKEFSPSTKSISDAVPFPLTLPLDLRFNLPECHKESHPDSPQMPPTDIPDRPHVMRKIPHLLRQTRGTLRYNLHSFRIEFSMGSVGHDEQSWNPCKSEQTRHGHQATRECMQLK